MNKQNKADFLQYIRDILLPDLIAAESMGYDMHRVRNDANGNPRYVIHWLAFGKDYDKAKKMAEDVGRLLDIAEGRE